MFVNSDSVAHSDLKATLKYFADVKPVTSICEVHSKDKEKLRPNHMTPLITIQNKAGDDNTDLSLHKAVLSLLVLGDNNTSELYLSH